ncbi:VWA domain-containing protein [Methylotetracoccus oryzae]|uniref:VWA domain-containing protein n=1 Tax=Methylotetracoccus oryzae TaxID=1919059 RepID=UPI00111AC3B4|nr:VWA domain-containing protein [Methylotetracoccus oryzae]
MTEAFHFLRPWWLLGFLPLALLLWRLASHRRAAGNLSELCDPALLPHLMVGTPARGGRAFGITLAGLGGTLALLALAGPVWERLPVPVFRSDDALVVALDLSYAMDATDLKPSRLDRARYKITDLLRARRDGQTALVIYAGDAFTVTPLTDDAATIQSQLSALTTSLPPVQGQRADLALELAARLLQQSGLRSGNVLMMTGDVDRAPTVATAERLKRLGYRVSVLGIGTESGGPVPRGRSGLWKDDAGNIRVPKLDPEGLRAVAQAGGGLYREVTSSPSDIERLLASFERPGGPQAEAGESQVRIEQWIETGPWLVLALLPLGALAFRRGGLLALMLLLLPLPRPASAFEWRDLWTKPDLAASKAFEAQQYDEAAGQFRDDAWRAAAQYRAGKYEDALKTLQRVDTVDGWYNRGNTLAKLQRYPDAIAAYTKVLERDPQHADAKYNKELLEKALKKKEQQQKKQSESGKDPQDSGQPEKKRSNEGQDAEKQDSDKQDQPDQKDGDQGEQPENQPEQQSAENSPPKDQKKGQDGSSQQPPQEAKKPGEPDSAQEEQGADQSKEAQADGAPENAEPKAGPPSAAPDPMQRKEAQQANEQWLRRIPDDPAGLLKRKFAWQYRQRQQSSEDDEQ